MEGCIITGMTDKERRTKNEVYSQRRFKINGMGVQGAAIGIDKSRTINVFLVLLVIIRGSGEAKYTMVTAIIGMGMYIDWIVRGTCAL